MKWANNFTEIDDVIAERKDIRDEMISLINSRDIYGKVLEGVSRISEFRKILIELTNGNISIQQATYNTVAKLPQSSSKYNNEGRVFPKDWAERLVQIQFSRFYNQAVLNLLLNAGESQCYIPTTPTQKPDSVCAKELAGRNHSIKILLSRLINSYENGIFTKDPKVPNHLRCSHVVKSI